MKKALKISLAALAVSVSASVFAEGNMDAGKEIATKTCAGCHNADGNSVIPTNPKLAGQHAKYTVKQLNDFKSGERVDGIMKSQAKDLSDDDIANIAAYFAAQEVKVGEANADKVALGEAVYRGGNSKTSVAACSACHSPTGSGNAAAGYPAISGQHQDYTKKQLNAFKSEGGRANDPASVMRDIAANMSDKEIDAVAEYIAGLH